MTDLEAFWGHTLQPIILPQAMMPLLPEKTLQFLSGYGLPTLEKFREERIELLHRLDGPMNEAVINNMNPRFEFEPHAIMRIEFQGESYVKIGYEYYVPIALKSGSGEVVIINGERPAELPVDLFFQSVTFVNSSIEYLLQFAALLLQSRMAMMDSLVQSMQKHSTAAKKDAARQRVIEAAEALERQFIALDPAAMAESHHRWPSYLAEYQDLY